MFYTETKKKYEITAYAINRFFEVKTIVPRFFIFPRTISLDIDNLLMRMRITSKLRIFLKSSKRIVTLYDNRYIAFSICTGQFVCHEHDSIKFVL